MSETPTPPQPEAPNGAPMMRVVRQYLKDLSFESPLAPQSVSVEQTKPAFDMGVDLNARPLENNQFEVELVINLNASRDGQSIYVVEVNYAGLFLIQNLPPEQLEPALLIEAPRLLFPFARQIVIQAAIDGGFPAVPMEPIDFVSIYRQQVAQRQAQTPGNA